MDVLWQPKAIKQLKKIGDNITRERILHETRGLADFPNVANIKKLKNHEYGYRLRVGDWRILFNVFEAVEIISIEEAKNGMSAPIKYQQIEYNGKSAYVLVPWEDWRRKKKVWMLKKRKHPAYPRRLLKRMFCETNRLSRPGANISVLRGVTSFTRHYPSWIKSGMTDRVTQLSNPA